MKKIPLTQGKFAIVDDEDYEWLMQWKWCAGKEGNNYYAHRKEGRTKTIKMHCQIMGIRKGMEIDHINHNALDNRRDNLRFCSHSENCRNRRPNKRAISKYKGVNWFREKWSAGIKLNGKNVFLGYFDNEDEAARAYDREARELFGKFAYLNFP